MPVCVADGLPAITLLRQENIFLIPWSQTCYCDWRPLKIVILNLMPHKIATEVQLLRLLANTTLPLQVRWLRIDHRPSRHTPAAHLDRFYMDFETVQREEIDALIVTGAPLGQVPFDKVYWWPQLQRILQWAQTSVRSTLLLCWAAQAALNVYYGLPKKTRTQKLSGIYWHEIKQPEAALTRGFDDQFLAPHSRYADFPVDWIRRHTDLSVLASSPQAGAYLIASQDNRQVLVTGHPEYDADTLKNEYERDCRAGLNPAIPYHYFDYDDPRQPPRAVWRSHGYLLFANWLTHCVCPVVVSEDEDADKFDLPIGQAGRSASSACCNRCKNCSFDSPG